MASDRERFLEALLASAVDYAIITLDLDGLVTSWNAGAEHLLGWNAAEMVGHPASNFFTIEDRRAGIPQLEMKNALTRGRGSDERWHLRKDGADFWANGEMMPLKDDNGDIQGFLKILRDRTPQRLAGEALRANAEFLHSVLASSGDCIKVLDLDGRVTFINEGGIRALELSDFNQIKNCPWPDFWHETGGAEAHAAIAAAKQGETGRFIGAASTFAGTPRWWDVQVTPIRGADGKPEKLLVVSRDITERKRIEEALEDDRRSLEILNRAGTALTGELKLERVMQLVTDAAMDVICAESAVFSYHVSNQNEPGHLLYSAAPDTPPAFAQSSAPLAISLPVPKFQGATVIRADDLPADPRFDEAAITPPDGIPQLRSFLAVPVLSPDGPVTGALLFAHRKPAHFTERHERLMEGIAAQTAIAIDNARLYQATKRTTEQLEQRVAELHESEARIRELNETLEQRVEERTRERDRVWHVSQDMLGVSDMAGIWRSINPAWRQILGWADEDIIGRTSEWLEHPDDREKTRAEVVRLSGQNQTTRGFVNRFRTANGDYRTLSWTAVPVEGLLYTIARDITEQSAQQLALVKAEDALRQSQKMEALGQLTGGIAHDFNNLLTGIIGSLDIVRRRLAANRVEDTARFMDAASLSAQRAAALTHRLLAFARRQSLDTRPVDVNRLVVGMEDLLQSSLGEQVKLQTVLTEGLWPALADENQLENAILNLAINARDAMPDGGRLTIETGNTYLGDDQSASNDNVAPGEYVVICVSDTGTGMSADIMAKAFDPFFTTKPIGKGTGLGLSMIYGFIKQSAGHVRIYSEEGQGTTIKMFLRRATEVQDEPYIDQDEVPLGNGETVLVVEDEASVRLIITDVLEELGYCHLEAASGQAALDILATGRRIDLLVTDVGLPNINGRQLAEIARATRPELKILFVTGYAEKAAARHGFLEPGMEMLMKPFALDELGKKIRQMIERR